MQISINGKTHHFEHEMTIDEIMEKLEISREGKFAVAHNETVVPHKRLQEQTVKDGDKLEIIHPTAGG